MISTLWCQVVVSVAQYHQLNELSIQMKPGVATVEIDLALIEMSI